MKAHTPGPWVVAVEIFDNDGAPETAIQALNGAASVAVALEFGPNNPQMRAANARLIAAAPMMLEALESVWLWMENQADGQSKGGHATFDLMMLREQRDIVRAAILKATGGAA